MIRLKGCLLAACLLSLLTQAADLGTWGDFPCSGRTGTGGNVR